MDELKLMSDETGGAIHDANGCLVVPVGGNLDEDDLALLGSEILQRLKKTRVHGVIINVTGLSILGSYGFTVLKNAARAVGMMGSPVVFVGFNAGIVSALVDLDMDFSGIVAVGTMDDAFDLLKRKE